MACGSARREWAVGSEQLKQRCNKHSCMHFILHMHPSVSAIGCCLVICAKLKLYLAKSFLTSTSASSKTVHIVLPYFSPVYELASRFNLTKPVNSTYLILLITSGARVCAIFGRPFVHHPSNSTKINTYWLRVDQKYHPFKDTH